MRFDRRPGLITFSDDRPGSNVYMIVDGRSAAFRDDASKFDDARCSYTWAFEYTGALPKGLRVVFGTLDRKVFGEVGDGGEIEVVATPSYSVKVIQPLRARSAGGTPAPSGARVRCLFVNPSVPYGNWDCHRVGVMNEASFSAHGMAYVSAALKAVGHECWLVDLRKLSDWRHVRETLRAQDYDVVFVGFLSIDAFNAAAVVRILKEEHPNKPVVVGGLHVSIAKEEVFPRPDLVSYYCWDKEDLIPATLREFLALHGERGYDPNKFPLADYVILNDGELAAQRLVADLAAGRTPPRTIDGGAVPMDVAKHPDRDLFDLRVEAYSPILPFQPTPMVTVTWARGCPFHCSFCNLSSQLSNTNVRQKPPEMIIEELNDIHRRFGGRVGSLMIHDDLTFHPKAIAAWCEAILSTYGPIPIWLQSRSSWVVQRYQRDREFWELLCRTGLTWISVGYESGSNRVLDYMKKDATVEEHAECGRILDEYGINSFGNFLWGVPTETNEEAEQTVRLVEKIKPGFLSGSVYCNFPGTGQDREIRENGLLVPGEVYERSHLPWQVRIKGVDYPFVYDCRNRAGRYANYLRMPKLLSEERQVELANFSRGLVIHGAGETQ